MKIASKPLQVAIKNRIMTSAVAYLRFKGYHDIKAHMRDFGPPQAVFLKASDAGYVPDMIAHKNFGTYVFEIFSTALHPGDDYAERWRVYTAYAARKEGRFYLITYAEEAEELTPLITELDPQPGVIQIRR